MENAEKHRIMKQLLKYLTIIVLLLITGCKSDYEDENSNEINTIEIGAYKFEFPNEFELTEGQGIDSYVGTVAGSGISLSFDFGWYTSPATNLSPDDYEIIEDNVDGHFRQIVRPVNPEFNYTRIHLYKVSDSINSPYGYNSLTMSTNNLTLAEQELVINIFNLVTVMD